MLNEARKFLILLGCTLTLAAAPPASASADTAPADPSAELISPPYPNEFMKAFDVIVLRPLEAGALACGVALMVPAAAMGLVGGTEPVSDSWDLLVLTSWESLVDRPLGHWGS